jgi:hypothetical protein
MCNYYALNTPTPIPPQIVQIYMSANGLRTDERQAVRMRRLEGEEDDGRRMGGGTGERGKGGGEG